jgi:hypothetical protein
MNTAATPTNLPAIVQDIADVLGRERALFLIGQLPRCVITDRSKGGCTRAERVILYVPKNLKPSHPLVRILGWVDAERLVATFGGELLNPPTMRELIYRPWRDHAIRTLVDQGTPEEVVAEWFGLTRKRVHQLAVPSYVAMGIQALEITKEDRGDAANDTSANEFPRSAKPRGQNADPVGSHRHYLMGRSR